MAGGVMVGQCAALAALTHAHLLPAVDFVYLRKKRKSSGTMQQLEGPNHISSRTPASPPLSAVVLSTTHFQTITKRGSSHSQQAPKIGGSRLEIASSPSFEMIGVGLATELVSQTATMSPLSPDQLANVATPALVSVAFGAGLLPSLAAANKAAFASLLKTPPELGVPSPAAAAGSTPLKSSPFLAYPATLYLDDVLDVVSRLSTDSSTPLGKLLARRKREGKLVRVAEFETAIAASPPASKPLVGPKDGKPLGIIDGAPSSSNATATPPPRRRLRNPLRRFRGGGQVAAPPPLALAATWAALSAGAPYVSPQEIERAIGRWRPDAGTFSLDAYEKNLVQGRAVVGLGYATLFGLQALVAVLLVLQPLNEYFSGVGE